MNRPPSGRCPKSAKIPDHYAYASAHGEEARLYGTAVGRTEVFDENLGSTPVSLNAVRSFLGQVYGTVVGSTLISACWYHYAITLSMDAPGATGPIKYDALFA